MSVAVSYRMPLGLSKNCHELDSRVCHPVWTPAGACDATYFDENPTSSSSIISTSWEAYSSPSTVSYDLDAESEKYCAAAWNGCGHVHPSPDSVLTCANQAVFPTTSARKVEACYEKTVGLEPFPTRRMSKSLSLTSDVTAALDIPPELLPEVFAKVARKKGKGGRQPAVNPFLDPNVDPKKAKRIVANRESAARSKLRQKLFVESLKTKLESLGKQKTQLMQELTRLEASVEAVEADNAVLESRVKTLKNQNQAHSGSTEVWTPLNFVRLPESASGEAAEVQRRVCERSWDQCFKEGFHAGLAGFPSGSALAAARGSQNGLR